MSIPGNLESPVPNVPDMKYPLYWNSARTVPANLNRIEMYMDEWQHKLPKAVKFDEAAVLVPSPWHANNLGSVLENNGWDHFNSASDLVFTNPFGTRYFVNYDFFRKEGEGYRLEVMHMGEGRIDGATGFSPLHAALWVPDGVSPNTAGHSRYPIPHISFKFPRQNNDQDNRSTYSRAVAHLQANGCIHAMTCQSTYGLFGYYLPNDANRQTYLKPRVNTRDAA